MREVVGYSGVLEIGEIDSYKNMAVAHLTGPDSGLDYLVLDEALKSGLTIEESGNVPFLNMTNKTGRKVLIIQGEYVRGGGQNRMIENNILIDLEFSGKVPVKCIQAHRWNPGTAPKSYEPTLKRAPATVYNATKFGQGEVWSQVNCLSACLETSSRTQDLDEITSNKQADTNKYIENFAYRPNSVGIIVAFRNNGKIFYGADIFDQSKPLEKNFRKLVESHSLNAIGGGEQLKLTKDEFRQFLEKISSSRFEEVSPISLGKESRIIHETAEGSSLVYEGRPLYITLADKFSPTESVQTGFARLR